MASSIKQINRIMAIDACLNSKHYSNITILTLLKYLADNYKIEVTANTIEKDFRKMRAAISDGGYNAPLYCDKGTNTYYYHDGDGNRIYDYVLNKLPLNSKELTSLQMAADLLSQFQDRGLGALYNDALAKINTFMKIETEPEAGNILIPETVKGKHTLELIPEIYQCIKAKKPIRFKYGKSADLLTAQQIVHPYLLKEFKSAWYLIGYSVSENWVLPFDLEFIEGTIEATELDFYMHEEFDAKVYFKHAIGVHVLDFKVLDRIELEFYPEAGQYVLKHPLHHTQKVLSIANDNMVRIGLEVYSTQELTDLVLSFGDRVKVVSGFSLIDALANDLRRAYNNYKHLHEKEPVYDPNNIDWNNPLLTPVKDYKEKKGTKNGK